MQLSGRLLFGFIFSTFAEIVLCMILFYELCVVNSITDGTSEAIHKESWIAVLLLLHFCSILVTISLILKLTRAKCIISLLTNFGFGFTCSLFILMQEGDADIRHVHYSKSIEMSFYSTISFSINLLIISFTLALRTIRGKSHVVPSVEKAERIGIYEDHESFNGLLYDQDEERLIGNLSTGESD